MPDAGLVRWLASYLAYLATGKRRRGRPLKDKTLGDLAGFGLPRRRGRKRKYPDEVLREWIDTIELAKKHFGVKTDKGAVEKVEEALRLEAGGSTRTKRVRIKKILPEIARARTRLGLNLRPRRRSASAR